MIQNVATNILKDSNILAIAFLKHVLGRNCKSWLNGECKLHVSTFATTRVALPTGVAPGRSTNGDSHSRSKPLFQRGQVTLPCSRVIIRNKDTVQSAELLVVAASRTLTADSDGDPIDNAVQITPTGRPRSSARRTFILYSVFASAA